MTVLVLDKKLESKLMTDNSLKDLFDRSEIINEENDEKLKNLILKSEVNEKGELINYIPETFSSKEKQKNNNIIDNKKNEKELDIEISKIRDKEINNLKTETQLNIENFENNTAKTELIINEELSLTNSINNRMTGGTENIKQEITERKNALKNEKELSMQTNFQREKEKAKEKNIKTVVKEIIKNENPKKDKENIKKIIFETNRTNKENIKDNKTKKHNNDLLNTNYKWEFNGILTIISENNKRTILFNRNGVENNYQSAVSKLSEAKGSFVSMVSKEKDYNMLIKDAGKNKILFYESNNKRYQSPQR